MRNDVRNDILRPLHDIDFVTSTFESIPASLARDYLFRHVHPLDPPGKTILQAIDQDEALRIDLFRGTVGIRERARRMELAEAGATGILGIGLPDLVARTASLVLELACGIPVPSKHARDFLRLVRLVDLADVEEVWPEHRKQNPPLTFREADERLQALIPRRQELLMI
jgi:hypothetical protein